MNHFELVDTRIEREGDETTLIDVYEHRETGERMEKECPDGYE